MATHSSILAWRIPGTGEPRGLPSVGSHRVRHDCSDLAAAAAVGKSVRLKYLPYLKTLLGTKLLGVVMERKFTGKWS